VVQAINHTEYPIRVTWVKSLLKRGYTQDWCIFFRGFQPINKPLLLVHLDIFAARCIDTPWLGLFGHHFTISCESIFVSYLEHITLEGGASSFLQILENPLLVRRWQLLPQGVRCHVIGKIIRWLEETVASVNEDTVSLCCDLVGFFTFFFSVDRDLLGHWLVLGEIMLGTGCLWCLSATNFSAMSRVFNVYGFLTGEGSHVLDRKASELQLKLATQMYAFTCVVTKRGLDGQLKKEALQRYRVTLSRMSKKNRSFLGSNVQEQQIATINLNEHFLSVKTNKESIKLCLWCLKGNGNGVLLKSCGKCRAVYYCSKKCQRKGWKNGHKILCYHFQVARTTHVVGW